MHTVDKANNKPEITVITSLLNTTPITVLEQCNEISLYTIIQKPIENSDGEMANKLVFQKKLDEEATNLFVQNLLDDTSYQWKNYTEKLAIYPTLQFVVKKDNEFLNVIYDTELKHIGFINLEGQNIIPATNTLHEIIMQLQ
ncbi:hypothetical protein KO494_02375 [Lacinutrix sp. C3R15]|uniref:hypothetical protein n=1 Tax=Flavobacteriaceae TaxID=49546 RepID=UPI001C092176|nr:MULTISPECIES: hypothetical protein [Flavobacteriaceae]MBU2938376.1 hypothetical protein [Lacinutrix sp. C3R15]MDO6621691.1 hypothetical protein [Oceanihabitans sp. 1_MG-2023]